MTNHIQIGSRKIGEGHPIFIMADIGLTNGGDMERTFKLIDVCKDLGVDAVKMQMIGPDVLIGDRTFEWTYQTYKDGPKTENMYEMFRGLTYTEDEWQVIASRIRDSGMEFICTSHYMGAVPILERVGVHVHKICTWSVTHKRLIQSIGRTGKPLMLDMGATSQGGLAEILDWYMSAGGSGAIVLHDFHTTDVGDMNFLAIPHIRETFGCPVGYTPQGRDSELDYMSIGLGVNVLEKRLTVDRAIPKNGHNKALEPDEFGEWLSHVRRLEQALGQRSIRPARADIEQSSKWFKSLFAKTDIGKGEVICDDMLEARRPGSGISARMVDNVVGRRAAVNLRAEKMLSWEDFD